jgi:hypothetical protein
MKKIVLALLFAVVALSVSAQSKKELLQQIADLTAKVETLTKSVAELEKNKVDRTTPCNPQWDKWSDVRYNYGFNTKKTPVFNTIDGVLESTVMLSVRGGLGRWNSTVGEPYSKFVDGGHLFEGWNASETCRLTMLIGKQAPDIACIQVYSPKGLYLKKRHFGWVKLGSDDACEGVDFGRRWAVSFVPFTLGRFDKAPTTTHYLNEQLKSTAVPVGTLYYDTVTDKIGCMTTNGWKYLKFE